MCAQIANEVFVCHTSLPPSPSPSVPRGLSPPVTAAQTAIEIVQEVYELWRLLRAICFA